MPHPAVRTNLDQSFYVCLDLSTKITPNFDFSLKVFFNSIDLLWRQFVSFFQRINFHFSADMLSQANTDPINVGEAKFETLIREGYSGNSYHFYKRGCSLIATRIVADMICLIRVLICVRICVLSAFISPAAVYASCFDRSQKVALCVGRFYI